MVRYAIIVAGGSGLRLGTEIPKQFIPVAGKPLLMHTINAFSGFNPEIKIILVLPGNYITYWEQLCSQYNFTANYWVAQGGITRSDSVKNGIELISDQEALVAIHDGARPFVDRQTISKGFELAQKNGAAIPSRELTDSARIIINDRNEPIDRTKIKTVQTPQCFRLSILRNAYKQANNSSFTDDASLVNNCGHQVHLYAGNPENIKITTPLDLLIAEAILRNKTQSDI
ncbi:MAG: 2-C-methyl-D-erythritol 4-phosphate cytidylyltransferase [Lentimicrobiaceae bacterium]|nr:2-C-methyl-D-erythritol 4-phosphate cytidylyltransferase [Lentimicrobiaceae bacterium]MCO5265775.1 2-C-methyl-D-erythritol 4-phosphate cytidylyltransferase [Lentimicrobium sp.]HPG32384.1 2-C-methyl-D-erythritol 4-phosphate cytidylyltransferase [Lentimicrobium sp.]